MDGVIGGTQIVRETLLAEWPDRFRPEELTDDAPLGEERLGLDSIEIVQVVLRLEDNTGRAATEELLARKPLLIRDLAEHFTAT